MSGYLRLEFAAVAVETSEVEQITPLTTFRDFRVIKSVALQRDMRLSPETCYG